MAGLITAFHKKLSILLLALFIVVAFFSWFLYFSNADNYKTYSISWDENTTHIRLEKKEENLHFIHAETFAGKEKIISSSWKLPYPVFHFSIGDVNGDGIDDIAVGVIKPTRFDAVPRKRIFIFKLFEGHVRPLWLGSRVSQPLEDFRMVKTNNSAIIRTIEIEKDGSFLVAEYKWKGFGISFIHYLARNIALKEAQSILAKN